MSNNLSDKQQMVLDYLKGSLRDVIDSHDMRDSGVFTEMFLSPQLEILEPLLGYLDDIRLAQSLSNADYITAERLDEIGHAFNNERVQGRKSEGYATFTFDDIPDSGYITIPRGIMVHTRGGLKFSVTSTSMYDEISISKHYDPSSFLYKIPVKVTSEGTGTNYNISPNEISGVEGSSLKNLIGVTNDITFIGGEDTETNEEFANRIRREQGAPNLGIIKGYEKMLDDFQEVEDKVVVGYRHPLMKRDVIGHIEIPGVKFHEGIESKHWGSKVDLYVRGAKEVEINKSYVLRVDDEGRLFVEIEENPIVGIKNIYMSIENSEFDPEETDIERLLVDRFTVYRNEDFETLGTLDEDCIIYFDEIQAQGMFRLFEGAIIDINYIYNALPEEVTEFMYGEESENRPPVADVKVKLARKKFVSVSVVAAMTGGSNMQTSDELTITNHLNLGIREVPLGGELQISDLVEQIYGNQNTRSLSNVDYIDLPFHFVTFEHHNLLVYECMSEEKKAKFHQAYIPEDFEVHFDYYMKNLTVSEFLETIYMLSRTSPVSHSEEEEEQLKFERYRVLQHAYEGAGIPKVLSPSLSNASEIEYFELSNAKVTEYKNLTEMDWIDFDYNFRSISQSPDGEVNIEALALFVIIISLLANEAENADERVFNSIKILETVEGLAGDSDA